MLEALDTGLWPRKRIPVILQAEMSECGLACLAMVLAAHGREVPLSTLRTRYPVSQRGMSLFQLHEVAGREGLVMNAYEVGPDELEPLQLPAIVHWDHNHYVVLKKMKFGSHVELHDPAIGLLRLSWKDFCERYSGFVAELSPSMTFKKEAAKSSVSAWAVLRSIGSYRPLLTKLLIVSLFLEMALLVSPLFLQSVVDLVLPVKDAQLLLTLATGFVCVTLVKVTARLAHDWTSMAIAGLINASFKSSVFSHLLHLPLAWFDKRGLGIITTRFASLRHIQDIVSEGIVTLFIDALLALVMLGVMLVYSAPLACVTLVVSVLTLVATVIVQRAYTRANNEHIQASGQEHNALIEIVSGIAAVKFFGREAQQMRVFQAAMMRAENRRLDTLRLHTLHGAATFTIQALEEIVVVALAASMVLNGTLTVGTMFGFYAYKQIFSTKIGGVANAMMRLRLLRLHAETVGDITLAELEPAPKGALQVSAKPRLRFADVSHRYPGAEAHTLRGFNLTIEPGEIVAVTGPSGAGKSTLLKLLTGAMTPESGAILVDGVDITKLPPRDYRQAMSVVLQEDNIFTGTIAENITMFESNADMARVQQAAEAACLHEDILDMPMQYQMHIFAGSPALSGGQKQRLLLARAFYKNAPLLILDEATSHLDIERERRVAQAIRDRGLTTLVVAHRQETLAGCDRVVVLEKYHGEPASED